MKNMTIVTGIGCPARLDLTSTRMRPRGDRAPGATPGIAFPSISPLGLAAIR